MSDVTALYTDGSYAANNPTWHAEDAPWKADQIMRVFEPREKTLRLCEVGCGVGGVMAELGTRLAAKGVTASLDGFDIAQGAIAKARELWAHRPEMTFYDQDILTATGLSYDVYLFIDVLEHLDQPVAFLKALRAQGMRRCIVHLPLENNWSNIMRGRTDPRRSKVGHLHFFDTYSAISMLEIAGLTVDKWVYTPELDLDVKLHRTVKSVAAYIPRKVLMTAAPALAVHTIGGAAFMANCSFRD